ncbi:glycerophosphodiester phosphodiesterase [Sporosarcina sp. P20a]|uniref:glycerophosphodiester phosphodiesterase n=1 Tax=Sporosarcina sp. P20a TaxID=2048256 RepID=UPI000C170B2B|nr:glycerophosphodiester phosphodiesterase [Sporosarcina sp. P20a]PIC86512.1 glycerophosphodiester phosphodiesterase [Sporosarcina sp. P20a]
MGRKTNVALTVGAASVAAWAASKVIAKQEPRAEKIALSFSEVAILTNAQLCLDAEVDPLTAYTRIADLGVHGFAVDVQLTKDEEILLVPNQELLLSNEIADYTVDELLTEYNNAKEFDTLHGDLSVVSLRELLEKFPQLLLIVSMSDCPTTYEGSLIPSKLWRLLKEMDATERVVVTSLFDEQIDRFNLYAQNSVALGAGSEEIKKAYVAYTSKFGHLYRPNADLFCLPEKLGVFPLASEGFVRFLQDLNIKVFYELNETDELPKLAKLDVDGFITSHPKHLLTFFNEN